MTAWCAFVKLLTRHINSCDKRVFLFPTAALYMCTLTDHFLWYTLLVQGLERLFPSDLS